MNSGHRLQAVSALQNKDESVYQVLTTVIVEHQLPPDSKPPERMLTEMFVVSRTGIKEAL